MLKTIVVRSLIALSGMGVAIACGASSTATPASGGMTHTSSGGTTSRTSNPGSATGGRSSFVVEGSAAEPDCAAAEPEDGFTDISPKDANIRYIGRVQQTFDAVAFAFPAVQIQTTFEGDAIDLKLRDYGLGTPAATNYYWVIVDGVASKLHVCKDREIYPLARNLSEGPHSLTVIKRTESGPGGQPNAGKGEFLGFRVREGTTLTSVDKPSRLMEFVGDSITCGYGNEVTTKDPDSFPFTSVNEDGWNAFGALTARALNADYVAVAASGRGVIRNYAGFEGDVVPKIYEATLHEDDTAPNWNHSSYSPDVIVVNLGTNDFSPGIELDQLDAHREAFKQGYSDFLIRLRELHAESTIVVSVGPMMSDGFPEGYNAWTSIRSDLKAVVEARNAAGDADVSYFEFKAQSSPYGEDWHPTIATHQKMANALVPFVAQLRGW